MNARIPATTIIQGQNVSLVTVVTRSNEFGILENTNYIMALKQLKKIIPVQSPIVWILVVSNYKRIQTYQKEREKKDMTITLKMETILRYCNNSSNWIGRRNEKQ
ncbi:hypothetical protein RFI_34632 [Reticulomyxa filosa]|uniref:Uncharacterized protein n=1 Tax=Reticulomyxa filosa TaxID=46433 RepID=X6LN30_RETFI|nr:hypothetical protein RFI_34632 [Reticulomyxa filosa]|eukprot:ETO02781.1 hypothetical protein RFI_34632 [Reticulomyxa filosa]